MNIQAKIDIQERNEGKKYCKGSLRQERSTIKVQTDIKRVLERYRQAGKS